jgi:hypothetical protein
MKYFPWCARIEPWHSEHLDLEKPLLREVFRDLDVTSRPALTCVCDEQYIRRGVGVRVYRVAKLKKSEKRKNRVQKMTKIEKKGKNGPNPEKSAP